MSIRIETIEQLKNTQLMEQVLDRLRRTTQPRAFAFKKRCKVLGDVPVLITAPPGRKLKSSLLKELRLGSPTLKGIVHRVETQLIFTFNTNVNKEDTAKWLAKCLHDAKAPVPLKCITIVCPTQQTAMDLELDELTSQVDKVAPLSETELTSLNNASLPEMMTNSDESNISAESIAENDTIESLLEKHISSKKLHWLHEEESAIEDLQARIQSQHTEMERLEQKFYLISLNIEKMQQPQSAIVNPWLELQSVILQSDLSLDTFRNLLAESSLNTKPLLRSIQALNPNDDILALKEIKVFCIEQAELWAEQHNQNDPVLRQQRQKDLLKVTEDLDKLQVAIEQNEQAQEERLNRLLKRRMETYTKLQTILEELPNADALLNILQERVAQCHQTLLDGSEFT